MSKDKERTWLLERIVLGERSEADAQPPLTEAERARLSEIRKDNDRILERYPPEEVAREVRRRAQALARQRRSRWQGGVAWAGAAVAVGLAAIVVSVPSVEGPSSLTPDAGLASTNPDERPALRIFAARDGELVPLEPEATVAPGERLQVRYISSGRRYGAIVSIDGAGSVVLHLPVPGSGELATRLASGVTTLPGPFDTTSAPGFVRLFFVTAAERFPTSAIVDAARRLAATPETAQQNALDVEGVEQASLLLRKASR